MPKENRSDWVAVAPQFESISKANEIRRAQSAYQIFQRDAAQEIKEEYGKVSDIAQHGRMVKEKWEKLSDERRDHYEQLSRQDKARFAQESHNADIAAIARREALQKEHNSIVLMHDEKNAGERVTRGGWQKTQKRERKKAKRAAKQNGDGPVADDNDDSEGSWDTADDHDEDSEEGGPQKAKRIPPKKKVIRHETERQKEYRAKLKREKEEKEAYIEGRQEDLRKKRSSQAKRRLEYLLKQGGQIFSHFGNVKADTAKYGIKQTAKGQTTRSRRDEKSTEEEDEEALEEADEHEATFLTAQPTTLGFGKMRPYQLEGLNWMIRLQENGVNGILADGRYFVRPS